MWVSVSDQTHLGIDKHFIFFLHTLRAALGEQTSETNKLSEPRTTVLGNHS